ncbi:hypothetical protein niasHT_003021 [Heterodera trifolii]|uniref:Uncharacterized protein n=1 Tax=Heterodera trifolii TaxID=157864 RepID=A0ABD2M6X5_9BILA
MLRTNHSSRAAACRPRCNNALRRFARAFFVAATIAWGVVIVVPYPVALGLRAEERSELARKFKYYHRTVRPALELNLLDTINGTFFRLVTELELQDTLQSPEGPAHRLNVDFALFVHYRDDRLLLRDLGGPMTIPDEFQPWMPRIQPLPMELAHGLLIQKSATFEPKTGHLTAIFRFYGSIRCDFDTWKMPFEQYKCHFWLETDPDERLTLRTLRDLRPDWQMRRIKIGIEHWPFLTISFNFKSHRWQHLLVSAYVPSLLLFLCSLLAQWRRRKIQVIVTMGALLANLILFHQHSHAVLPLQSSATLLDVWFGGVFIHLVCLLCLELALPARQVLVFKKADSTLPNGTYKSSPIQNGRTISSSQPLYSTPHYVSSTHLLHQTAAPPPLRSQHANAVNHPTTPCQNRHITPPPGQLIRTRSVPHRRTAHGVPHATATTTRPAPAAAQSEPLQRKMTAPPPVGLPLPLPRADSGEQRAQRIATLLSEMENIRRETEREDGTPSLRHADSVVAMDEQLLVSSSEEVLIKTSFAAANPSPTKEMPKSTGDVGTISGVAPLNTYGIRRFVPSPIDFSGIANRRRNSASADSDELGRAERIPRRKKLMLGFVALSFSLFFTSYVLLVVLFMFEMINFKSNLL